MRSKSVREGSVVYITKAELHQSGEYMMWSVVKRACLKKYFIVKIDGSILFIILCVFISYHHVEWHLPKRGRKKLGIGSKSPQICN